MTTQKDEHDSCAELIGQTIPDVAETEPRLNRSNVDTSDNAIYALFIVREFLDKLDAELERQQPTPTAIRLSAQQVIAAVRDFTKAMEQAIPEPSRIKSEAQE